MAPALFIDDDKGLLASVKATLDTMGISVVTASSWDEGVGLFHVLGPNIVVADYNLPGSLNGLKLLARIKQYRPAVRLVLVSGYLNDDDVDAVEQLGIADRALTKGSAIETAEAIVGEIRGAAAPEVPTDWAKYSTNLMAASGISEEDLLSIDNALRQKVESNVGH